jgi:hypothetical protein
MSRALVSVGASLCQIRYIAKWFDFQIGKLPFPVAERAVHNQRLVRQVARLPRVAADDFPVVIGDVLPAVRILVAGRIGFSKQNMPSFEDVIRIAALSQDEDEVHMITDGKSGGSDPRLSLRLRTDC